MMRNRFAPYLLIVLAFSALSLLVPAIVTAARAQQGGAGDQSGAGNKPQDLGPRGERKAREIRYGDWQKFCFKTPGTNVVCRTTISGTWETGQTAVRIDLIEREGEDTGRFQLFLPVGLYLQTAAKLSVDQGKPVQIPYVWCLTNACIAGDKANPGLVKEMESGEKLKLEVVDTNLLSVSTELPLGQFASVRKAAPTQIFQQDVDE
jgi:invasion protein IalB